MRTAAFTAALRAGEHPVSDRSADGCAMARTMGEDLIPAPSAEGIELFLAELQQSMALLLTEIDGSDQAVDTSGVGCDAVRGQPPSHHSGWAAGI